VGNSGPSWAMMGNGGQWWATVVKKSSKSHQKVIKKSSKSHQKVIKKSAKSHQKVGEKLECSWNVVEV
jgi:hypothetical protein